MKSKLLATVSLLILGMAAPAWADAPADAASPADSGDLQEIIVYGKGETHQVQTLSATDIAVIAPGSSPLKAVSMLPGVNYQASDPFGAYEWAVRISVRGFNQNQMGFTLDGVPLGDMSYGNDNGLHISRAIAQENIGHIDMAQGTGALGTASTSNLGGTLAFFSKDPDREAGAFGQVSGGSNSTARVFGRLESGVVDGGGSGYISYNYQHGDKWKGDGEQYQQQANAKWVQPVGDATWTTWINFSDRHENDYQDLSRSLIHDYGYRLDNISNNYALATAMAAAYQAGKPLPGPYSTANGNDGIDAVYYDGAGNRRDLLGASQIEKPLTDNLTFKGMVYGHWNMGMGTWDTPYVPTPAAYGGSPISMRTTEYGIARIGTIDSLSYVLGDHTIDAGLWFENNDFDQARRYYGLGLTSAGRKAAQFQADPFATQWQYAFNTKTYVVHLDDTWKVTRDLKLTAGFKSMFVDETSTQVYSGSTLAAGSLSTDEPFLPQVGIDYNLDDVNEFFADYAHNARAFVAAATTGPFSTSQAGFNSIQGNLKPETSDTYEVGYRLHLSTFEGVLAGYYVNFQNRLNTTTVGTGIQGLASALANVGDVTTKGVEVGGTWHFIPDWSLTANYTYNDSTYDNDEYTGTGVLQALTKGKTVVDSPRNMIKGELSYDNGALFGGISGTYMSERFYTYTNDGKVPGYAIFDLDLGYRFQGSGWQRDLVIQGNITNLLDRGYISSIGTNGFVDSDPNGTFQTLQAGAPRSFFITVKKQF